MQTFMHDPDAKLDYAVDWTAWLSPGETIVLSTWAVVIGTATLTNETLAGAKTSMFVEAASVPKVVVTNSITTDKGRKDDRSLTLIVAEK